MKKKTLILLILLLFTTGCSCEYNLVIDGDAFKENVSFTTSDTSELNMFNKEWNIPIDKDIYNIGTDPGTTNQEDNVIYNYKLSNNNLIFNYDFNMYNFTKSSAVSNCYNTVNVNEYGERTIISTGSKAICFDNYPTLTDVTVNITVDRTVTNHNADKVNGNTYTWNINRNNANNKSINLILEGTNMDIINPSNSSQNKNDDKVVKKSDYTMYIFAGALLIVLLTVYAIYKKITSKEDSID